MQSLQANTFVIAAQGTNPARELREAAQEIRDEIQREIQQAQAERASSRAQGPTPPAHPAPAGTNVFVSPVDGQPRVLVEGSGYPWAPSNDIPPQAVEMTMGFLFTLVAIVIGLPIARAFARRMDRKAVAPQVPAEVTAQLGQLAQAVDAIALEVERISEGQRFTTRLLSEQRDAARHALPTGSDR